MKTIAVYGSSIIQPHEQNYKDAYKVGQALAKAGFAVVSGGYGGIMEAASHGAAEAGGHVIGVTSGAVEAHRGKGTKGNQWVKEEIHYETMRERMMHLVNEPDGYVIMSGGLGTLNELAAAWEFIRIGELPRRPIICYGDYWNELLDALRRMPYMKPSAWEILQYANTAQEIIDILHKD